MKKFLSFIKRPPVWFLFVWLIFTLCAIAAAVVCMLMADGVLNYILYALAALSLGYLIYLIAVTAPKVKGRITEAMNKRKFTSKLLQQYSFRTVVFAVGSFTLSTAYVVFNGVLGVINRSVWYGSLAAYYLLLAVMRGVVLNFHRKKGKLETGEEVQSVKALKIYRMCGVGLVVLPVALSAAILYMVVGKNSFQRSGYSIYVAALYAFYKIIMSVYNAVKAKKSDDATISALRNINLADAFVSILALQTTMFKEFGGDLQYEMQMNAATGAIVCVLTAVLGVAMIVTASKKLKENRDGREV
ncbi:MAG: hypothetical protein ACI4QN_03970 [Candidatus Coproplasma sp.]